LPRVNIAGLSLAGLRCESVLDRPLGNVHAVAFAGGGRPLRVRAEPWVLYLPELRLQVLHGNVVPLEAISVARSLDFEKARRFQGLGAALERPFVAREDDREVCVLSNLYSRNFSHWMIEELAKVVILETMGWQGGYVLYDQDDWARDLLALMGVARERIIECSGQPTLFRAAVYVEAINFASIIEWPAVLHALRERLLPARGHRADGAKRRLLLERGKKLRNGGRILVNRDEVLPVLARYGVEAIDMAEYPVAEQIAIACNASLLVGYSATASMVHSIFLDPGSAVVECMSPNYVNPCFFATCRILKLRYSQLVHANAFGSYVDGMNTRVDCAHLELVLAGLC
jgi:capsular polysaccharide biosynthesis protein